MGLDSDPNKSCGAFLILQCPSKKGNETANCTFLPGCAEKAGSRKNDTRKDS
jgi:hypothetical protein